MGQEYQIIHRRTTFLTIGHDIHGVHYRPQIAGASRDRYRGTAVTGKLQYNTIQYNIANFSSLEWLIQNKSVNIANKYYSQNQQFVTYSYPVYITTKLN